MFGENGIITQAQETTFRTEMAGIREAVDLKKLECKMDNTLTITNAFAEQITITEAEDWDLELKMEIIYWGQYEVGINKITRQYAKEHWKEILKSKNEETNLIDNLYYIDADTAGGYEHRYLYDTNVDIIYKIPLTRIGNYKVHSIEELDYQKVNGSKEKEPMAGTLIRDVSNMVEVDGISYYEPDLSGFILENTSLIYYSSDMQSSIPVSAQEYIQKGRQRVIEKEGKQYELYNYKNQLWANMLVENAGMKSYWVWIPRYSYQVNKANQETAVKFISLEATPESGYIVHSDFEDGKKGIWVSKYEPIQTANTEVEDFPYYVPDMTGFNSENTYVEVYNKETNTFTETKLKDISNLTAFARNNNWFDYQNQVWANIKTEDPNNHTEAWWVWIPRYAYNITGNQTSIMFIDTNNHPLTGGSLPSNYVVHPAFNNNKKGIWVSKYEPVQKIGEYVETAHVNPPDLRGYHVDNTYIECYNEATNRFEEQTLRSILSNQSVINSQNIVEQVDIDYSKIKGTWYSYDKKIWANIKTVDPSSKTEAWWVWIPRYAYNIMGTETTIIYLNSSGNPIDGGTLPSNYVPHPAFNESTEGIWASKYEPIEK